MNFFLSLIRNWLWFHLPSKPQICFKTNHKKQAIAYLLSPVFFMICDHLIIDQTAFTTIDKQGAHSPALGPLITFWMSMLVKRSSLICWPMTIHMHERNIKKATVFSKQSAMIIIRKHQDINNEIMQGIDQVVRIVWMKKLIRVFKMSFYKIDFLLFQHGHPPLSLLCQEYPDICLVICTSFVSWSFHSFWFRDKHARKVFIMAKPALFSSSIYKIKAQRCFSYYACRWQQDKHHACLCCCRGVYGSSSRAVTRINIASIRCVMLTFAGPSASIAACISSVSSDLVRSKSSSIADQSDISFSLFRVCLALFSCFNCVMRFWST